MKRILPEIVRYVAILLAIFMAITTVFGFWKINRLAQNGIPVQGKVVRIDTRSDRGCGSGFGFTRRSSECTRFMAQIEYSVNGVRYSLKDAAGQANGATSDTSKAIYREGESVTVLHDPKYASLAMVGDAGSAGIFRYLVLLGLLPAIGLLWWVQRSSRSAG